VSDPALPPLEGAPISEEVPFPSPVNPARRGRALQITMALLVVIVCLELGLFLLVFPWTDYWTSNYFAAFIPQYFWIWDSAYFKGAISGLGVVNLCICGSEMIRLRRFAGPQ